MTAPREPDNIPENVIVPAELLAAVLSTMTNEGPFDASLSRTLTFTSLGTEIVTLFGVLNAAPITMS